MAWRNEMEVKTIEVCNANNIKARKIFKKRNLSRLLLALLAKSTAEVRCRWKRRTGTINHYYVLICFFIPYRQNLAYAPFCHFPRRRKRVMWYFASQSYIYLPISYIAKSGEICLAASCFTAVGDDASASRRTGVIFCFAKLYLSDDKLYRLRRLYLPTA